MKRFLTIFFITTILLNADDNSNKDSQNDNLTNKPNMQSVVRKEVFDPLSGYNRVMTSFNDKVFTYFTRPVAIGYAYVVPEVARTGISNFFTNLFFPIRFVNNLLQLKFENAGKELGRFLVNTIWGFGGFMDQATNTLGMEIHREDFGQTLAYWGVGDGFPVVLPFLGQTNLRDMFGIASDMIVSPTQYSGHNVIPYKIPQHSDNGYAIDTIYGINEFSHNPDAYEQVRNLDVDLYIFLRDNYKERRDKAIKE